MEYWIDSIISSEGPLLSLRWCGSAAAPSLHMQSTNLRSSQEAAYYGTALSTYSPYCAYLPTASSGWGIATNDIQVPFHELHETGHSRKSYGTINLQYHRRGSKESFHPNLRCYCPSMTTSLLLPNFVLSGDAMPPRPRAISLETLCWRRRRMDRIRRST